MGEVDLATSATLYTGAGIGLLVAGVDLGGDGAKDLVAASSDAIWSVNSPLASGPIDSVGIAWEHALVPYALYNLGDTDGDGTGELAVSLEYVGPITRATDPFAVVVISGADPSQPSSYILDPYLETVPLGGNLYGVAAPGDTDGDGLSDLVIGSNNAEDNAGGVYLFRGPLPEATALGEQDAIIVGGPDGRLGYELVSGDFDGDGRPDLACETEGGLVSVLFVPTDVQGSVLAETIAFGSIAGPLSALIKGTADLDNDGADDLLLRLYDEDQTVIAQGPFSGERTSEESVSAIEVYRVQTVGDIDGDGADDLAGEDRGEGNGPVWLWYGPLSGVRHPSDADATLIIEEGGTALPNAIAGLGDINGDGAGELAIGSFVNGGTVYVLFGGPR